MSRVQNIYVPESKLENSNNEAIVQNKRVQELYLDDIIWELVIYIAREEVEDNPDIEAEK